MKIQLFWIVILTLINCVRLDIPDVEVLADQPQLLETAQEDKQQLSQLIAPNEHTNEKRSHSYRSSEELEYPRSKYLYRPRINLPPIMNRLEEQPEELEESEEENYDNPISKDDNEKANSVPKPDYSVNNIPAKSFQAPLNPVNNDETPKFIFSSMHMKLIPNTDEIREDALLKDLNPGIQQGIIGLPELIKDAHNPDSSESELLLNNRPSGSLIIATISQPSDEDSLPYLDNPITMQESLDQISPTVTTPPSTSLLRNNKPSQNSASFGAIDSASKSKKSFIKEATKSNIKVITNKNVDSKKFSNSKPGQFGGGNRLETNKSPRNNTKEGESKPSCPSGNDFVTGAKDLWKGFYKAATWSRSFGAVADSAKNATKSVGSCIKHIWGGVKRVFGYGKDNVGDENSQPKDTKKSRKTREANKTASAATTTKKPKTMLMKIKEKAQEVKKGFTEKVAKPTSGFFNDLGGKAKNLFSRQAANNYPDFFGSSETD